jgi:hypothetical protein
MAGEAEEMERRVAAQRRMGIRVEEMERGDGGIRTRRW